MGSSQDAKCPDAADVWVEASSKIRVRGSRYTQGKIDQLSKEYCKLKVDELGYVPVRREARKCVFGVLGRKRNRKVAGSGEACQVWTLSNLEQADVEMLVFGKAYDECQECQLGLLLVVFDPFIQLDKFGKRYMTAELSGQIRDIGIAVDYGLCTFVDQGKSCKQIVNKSAFTLCPKHAQAGYNRILKRANSRSDIGGIQARHKLFFNYYDRRKALKGVGTKNPNAADVTRVRTLPLANEEELVAEAQRLPKSSQGKRMLMGIVDKMGGKRTVERVRQSEDIAYDLHLRSARDTGLMEAGTQKRSVSEGASTPVSKIRRVCGEKCKGKVPHGADSNNTGTVQFKLSEAGKCCNSGCMSTPAKNSTAKAEGERFIELLSPPPDVDDVEYWKMWSPPSWFKPCGRLKQMPCTPPKFNIDGAIVRE
eukprot:evm.model.scf_3473.1 EVM.evm.TU.scf_3473.1   scf_3473:4257-7783(-)